MVLPAIIAGGVALGSALLANRGQAAANKKNIALAREQMRFQERMSSTSFQRGVADMKLAGINPMLAYMKGGASSPQGARPEVKDVIGPAVNSAVSALRLRNEIQMNMAQRKLVSAQTFKTTQEGMQARATAAAMYSAPQEGGDRGIPYYLRHLQATWSRARLENEVIKLGMPAAKVRGSKLAALWQVYGRSIAGGIAGVGAVKFGAGFLRGRR